MDAVPGLDLSQPPFDLLDEAARQRLAARVTSWLESTQVEGAPTPP